MSIVREILHSTKGRIAIAVLIGYAAWQIWLSLAAPGKIAPGFRPDAQKVDILVTLPFAPERFHVIALQRFGRVSGTQDDSIEVRGVNKAKLLAVARPYWVRRVEPLPNGG